MQAGARHRPYCLPRYCRVEISLQLGDILGEALCTVTQVTAECTRGALVGTRRAPQPKVNPAGEQ